MKSGNPIRESLFFMVERVASVLSSYEKVVLDRAIARPGVICDIDGSCNAELSCYIVTISPSTHIFVDVDLQACHEPAFDTYRNASRLHSF